MLPRGLAPRATVFAEPCADSYTSGALKRNAPCRCCPGVLSLEGTRAPVTPMARKEMVAGPGIAPGSSALQAGALTDSAIQRGPSAWFRATVCRLSGGGSAIELQRGERKVVARDGNALPSAGCGPAALLLSYRAMGKIGGAPGSCRSGGCASSAPR